MRRGGAQGLVFALAAAMASADETGTAAGPPAATHRIVAGPEYAAGGFHRWLFGSGYRALWTTPVEVEVLDLQAFSGGLVPTEKGGGKQTKGLRFKGADGREWRFRSVNKDPSAVVPDALRGTFVDRIIQDQISASLPANGLVVDVLAEAAGLINAPRRLVVLPDDPRLGEFRKEFAGTLGTIEERLRVKPPVSPGLAGFSRLVDSKDLEEILDADSRERVDSRAFLRARLFDVVIGDYDRHRDQWEWASDGGGRWVPVPRDRDLAFVRFDGLVLDLARRRAPRLVNFEDDDLSVIGLTWQARFLDRRHLSDLEWPAWAEVAADLQRRLTDEVVGRALSRLPPAYGRLVGARVAARLKARRDGLPTFARQYYQLLAREAEVYAADQADSVQILRRADRSLDLVLAGPAGPYYRRRFRPSETKEVRVFLKDGDDRALSEGSDGSIKVRLVGGEGNDFLDDSAGGHTRLYDSSGDNRVVKGPGTRTSDRPYTAPLDRVGHPQRDWGSRNEALPHASWSGDYGAILGGTLRRTTFGFRRHPYATRHTLRAGYSTRLTGADVAYEYESLRTDNRTRFAVAAEASSLDVIHFYGFGNETPGAAPEEFNDVTARQIALAPSYRLDVTGIDVTIGPVAKYTDAHPPATSLIGQQRPYGVGRFGQAGARLAVTLDGRDPEMSRALGALVSAEGSFYPPVWSVSDSFGEVHGEAALLAAATPVPGRPMLALRVGGKKVFGRYPFQEAAAIGGSRSVRGLPRQRYIGDAAVFGNGELRLTLRDRRGALLPRFGVFGLADAGRVFVEGETSDRWHTGLGGGLWFAVMEPGNLVSLTVARSEGLVRVYLHGGFTF